MSDIYDSTFERPSDRTTMVKKSQTIIRKHVVAAVIIDQHKRVYIQQRPIEKEYGGMWELPGGKVTIGETLEKALIRELSEELVEQYPTMDTQLNLPIQVTLTKYLACVQKENYLLHFIECLSHSPSTIRPKEQSIRYTWIGKETVGKFQLIKEDKLFLLEEVLI